MPAKDRGCWCVGASVSVASAYRVEVSAASGRRLDHCSQTCLRWSSARITFVNAVRWLIQLVRKGSGGMARLSRRRNYSRYNRHLQLSVTILHVLEKAGKF